MNARLVLASTSSSRRKMLSAAGIAFTAEAPDVDEDAVKTTMLRAGAAPEDIAMRLSDLKALSVSTRNPGAVVIGSDQILESGGRLFSKAADRDAARAVLQQLRKQAHRLITGAAVARDGVVLWRIVETASLAMRDFSDEFLETYLDEEGEDILGSVGCYRIEGRGAQLFTSVSGCQFVIRGLPLLALLAYLRGAGAIEA